MGVKMKKDNKKTKISVCDVCGITFKQSVYANTKAIYCSSRCKGKAKRERLKNNKPEQLKEARRRSYLQTKKHPDRLAKHRESCRRYRNKTRQWLADYKLKLGCIDCGFKDHFAALELDHEGIKTVSISEARSSIARLEKEIKEGKCVVRCANCHAIKTWERKQIDV